jgi:hypothetical protein
MFAVSVQHPQAAAILAALGPVTCRFWRTDYRGPLLIHAARRPAGRACLGWAEGLACNAILGVVELADCVRTDHPGGDPDEATYRWVLVAPRAFARPLPYHGRQGLFHVADAAVAGALALAARPQRGGGRRGVSTGGARGPAPAPGGTEPVTLMKDA